MKNFFIRRRGKAVKSNLAMHPFVIVSILAAITMVIFFIAVRTVKFK